LNPPPILGLLFLALPLAMGRPLRGLELGFIAMRANEAPRIVMDRSAIHGLLLCSLA
jgi:hypothetical protein